MGNFAMGLLGGIAGGADYVTQHNDQIDKAELLRQNQRDQISALDEITQAREQRVLDQTQRENARRGKLVADLKAKNTGEDGKLDLKGFIGSAMETGDKDVLAMAQDLYKSDVGEVHMQKQNALLDSQANEHNARARYFDSGGRNAGSHGGMSLGDKESLLDNKQRFKEYNDRMDDIDKSIRDFTKLSIQAETPEAKLQADNAIKGMQRQKAGLMFQRDGAEATFGKIIKGLGEEKVSPDESLSRIKSDIGRVRAVNQSVASDILELPQYKALMKKLEDDMQSARKTEEQKLRSNAQGEKGASASEDKPAPDKGHSGPRLPGLSESNPLLDIIRKKETEKRIDEAKGRGTITRGLLGGTSATSGRF